MVRLHEFPMEDELVIGTVKSVKGFGAFVTLDEYKGKEGFVHIAEVASGWVKYIRDYIREGQKVVCKVQRVNPSKGHIDLSLKAVNEHQRRDKIQEWKNEQKAEKLFELVCDRLERDIEDCYRSFGNELVEVFGTLYGAFEECTIDENVLEEEEFEGDWIDAFVEVAHENIVPPYVDITGYVELMCPAKNGMEHIKEALHLCEGVNDDVTIEAQYVGAPHYRLKVNATDFKTAEDRLRVAAKLAIDFIVEHEGEGEFHREWPEH